MHALLFPQAGIWWDFPSNTWWLLLNSKPKHDLRLCEQGASSAPFHKCLPEDLWRAGWGSSPQVISRARQTASESDVQIVLGALGKRLGAGGAKTLPSHRVLRCDFPALLRSDLVKVCLQHRKLLDVCSWKVVVYMYIFTLPSRNLQTCASSWQTPHTQLPAVAIFPRGAWQGTFYVFNLLKHAWTRPSGASVVVGEAQVHLWMSRQLIAGPFRPLGAWYPAQG